MRVINADCVRGMSWMAPDSIDAIVCDPPYGLAKEPDALAMLEDWLAWREHERTGGGFMGKHWDSFVPGPRVWRECFRVLKPGGHLLAFAGTRTEDLMGLAIRLAGFERKDTLVWLYGSGFPKGLNVANAIDAKLYDGPPLAKGETPPRTPEGERMDGWNTTLKPAHEPIIVARKPLLGTVAANVLEHGTGALNIDGTRIGFAGEADEQESKQKNRHADFGSGARENHVYGADARPRGENGNYDPPGRWPANVLLDAEAAAMLDAQTGTLTSGSHAPDEKRSHAGGNGVTHGAMEGVVGAWHGDSGGASRFFYCAKASRRERNAGLDDFEVHTAGVGDQRASGDMNERLHRGERQRVTARNTHPTVKPVDVMRWLCRLVTPSGGIVLDPFVGSGTTGIAAALEGFRFVGIEQDDAYAEIARARIAWWAANPSGKVLPLPKSRVIAHEGQLEMEIP